MVVIKYLWLPECGHVTVPAAGCLKKVEKVTLVDRGFGSRLTG
jgi:hypothetical protein